MTNSTKSESIAPAENFISESDEFAFLLEEVPRLLRREFEASIAEFGLSRTQWRALAYLTKAEGQTQTELAACLELERASVGKTIDSLEKLDFVERRSVEGDRRSWRIFLKPAARKIIPELRAKADAVYGEMLDGLSDNDISTTRAAMTKIAQNLGSS